MDLKWKTSAKTWKIFFVLVQKHRTSRSLMKVWGHVKCGKQGVPQKFICQSTKPMHLHSQNRTFSARRSIIKIVNQPSRWECWKQCYRSLSVGTQEASICYGCCHLRRHDHLHLLFWKFTCFKRIVTLQPIPPHPNTPTKLPATTTKATIIVLQPPFLLFFFLENNSCILYPYAPLHSWR